MTAVSLPELKNYLRYEDDDASQDTALGLILAGAQRWVENYTGHLLVPRAVTQTPLAFGAFIDLRWKPYQADSLVITYLDSNGDEQEFNGFTVSPAQGTMRVKASEWPTATGGITLTYFAGYEDAYDVPEDILLGVCLFAGMTDQERGEQNSQTWKSLQALLDQYHLPVLA